MVDDGERFNATLHAFAVLFITVLKKHPSLTVEHIPNLRHVLRMACDYGEHMNSIGDAICDYPPLLRRIGRAKLGPTDQVLEAQMVEEWKASLDAEALAEMKAAQEEENDEEEDDEDEDPDAWMVAQPGDAKVKDTARQFSLAGPWKDYKDCLRESPNVPLRGPPYWDIDEWTEQDKKPFLLSNSD